MSILTHWGKEGIRLSQSNSLELVRKILGHCTSFIIFKSSRCVDSAKRQGEIRNEVLCLVEQLKYEVATACYRTRITPD